MNRNLKKGLMSSFQAPPPTDRERFLKQLRYPKITYWEFLLAQLAYIRKCIWIAFALIVFLGWVIAFRLSSFQYWSGDGLRIWSISAILPFLAMMTITEIYRSSAYIMAELEASCRFSLLQIVMARISIFGAANFIVLILLLIFINQISAYSLLQTILYTIMPYLFVCTACLWLLNRFHGSDGIYACAAAAGFVSVSSILCEGLVTVLYTDVYLNSWLTLFAICLVAIGFQMHKFVKKLEEKQWNWNLTE
ncbi:hypothetical protein [Lacrimispora sp.]|uniref:hypothetical protein n=1 Tax=Lacrimispora sp. TaxID=2719234 RepID=UPI0032E4F6BB